MRRYRVYNWWGIIGCCICMCVISYAIFKFNIQSIKTEPEVFFTKDGCTTTKTYYMGERLYNKECEK